MKLIKQMATTSKQSKLPPVTTEQLLNRAKLLCNKNIAQIATELGINVPKNLTKQKGWLGQLLEMALGATSGSKPEPDFPELGIELKTIPVTKKLKPIESTYVCTAPTNNIAITWQQSWAYRKLRSVLWIPIISDTTSIATRKVLAPILWQPDPETQTILQQDWEEITEIMQLDIESLNASIGTYLHVRPKGASNKAISPAISCDATAIKIVPRGFYLRQQLTQKILNSGK